MADEDEIEIEADLLGYPDTVETEEQRRAYVLRYIGSGEIDGKVLVENCAIVEQWLKTGETPKAKDRPKIAPVKA